MINEYSVLECIVLYFFFRLTNLLTYAYAYRVICYLLPTSRISIVQTHVAFSYYYYYYYCYYCYYW
jgi:hypothetical protein